MTEENDHNIIASMLAKGTEHKAPQDLSDRVWSALINTESRASKIRPLISNWMWVIIGVFVLGFTFVAASSSSNSSSRFNWGGYLQPISDLMGESLFNIPLITFSSFAIMTVVILFNSTVMNSHYRKMSH